MCSAYSSETQLAREKENYSQQQVSIEYTNVLDIQIT